MGGKNDPKNNSLYLDISSTDFDGVWTLLTKIQFLVIEIGKPEVVSHFRLNMAAKPEAPIKQIYYCYISVRNAILNAIPPFSGTADPNMHSILIKFIFSKLNALLCFYLSQNSSYYYFRFGCRHAVSGINNLPCWVGYRLLKNNKHVPKVSCKCTYAINTAIYRKHSILSRENFRFGRPYWTFRKEIPSSSSQHFVANSYLGKVTKAHPCIFRGFWDINILVVWGVLLPPPFAIIGLTQ